MARATSSARLGGKANVVPVGADVAASVVATTLGVVIVGVVSVPGCATPPVGAVDMLEHELTSSVAIARATIPPRVMSEL